MAQRSLSLGTQAISHLLAGVFEDLSAADVTGEDVETRWTGSQGGADAYQERFAEELQKLLAECQCRATEADRAEENIVRAQERARAEEERALTVLRAGVGDSFPQVGLPPVASSFRRIVDNELLRKSHLTCPDDYIPDKSPVTRAPRGKPEPGCVKETSGFQQRVSLGSQDQVPARPQRRSGSLTHGSLSTLPQRAVPDPQKTKASPKAAWKDGQYTAERESARAYLARLERRQNYLKNPHFFPPHAPQGGKSLIVSPGAVEQAVARGGADPKGDTALAPVFLANPATVLFSDYEVGQVYEMTVELQNVTSTCHHVRVIPPSTSAFAIGPGKFPGKGGMIAPGMTCQFTVQFIPEHLGGYEDCILVETQVPEPLRIPIQAERAPPVLPLPHLIDCGSCLVGRIKVTTILCRNEGVRTAKFRVTPKKAWPPPDTTVVDAVGFVTQGPFGIHPGVFELAPGQSTVVEVAFFPSFPEVSEQTYTVVCDNGQVSDVTVTGLGQLIALQLLSVTGGESGPEAGEVPEGTAQHLVQFEPQNPHTTEEKKLLIRNSTGGKSVLLRMRFWPSPPPIAQTKHLLDSSDGNESPAHVELPFYWQIIKPSLKPLIPGETGDFTKLERNGDTESAFSLTPEQGVLLPQGDHEFVLTYTPQQLKSYRSVIQMVLRDTPASPWLVREGMLHNIPGHKADDVVALEIEVKGSTEPFQLLLEPYAVIVPGENFIGVTVRKTFKMWNNSKSLIKYTWEKVIASDIMEVEPHTGIIDTETCCEFELAVTGSKPGRVSRELRCTVEHSPEPVVLRVEAAFKGPRLCIDAPSLRLGVTKRGERVSGTFGIKNVCQLPARWRLRESGACLAERNEEVSPFTIQPSAGEIAPLGTCRVSVQFSSLLCQRLQTVLELEVENGEGSHLPVFVEVQTPQACLVSSRLVFTEMFTGVPAKAPGKLFNQTLLPAQYFWGKLTGAQAAFCSVAVSPASGTLGPNEELEFCVELSASVLGELTDLALCCSVEGMAEPLFLRVSGEVKGLHVTYSVPCDSGAASDDRQTLQSPCDLLLDFGSEVAFKDTVKRQLILTNDTGISAPFRLEAEYFTAYSPAPAPGTCPSLVKRGERVSKHAARRAETEFAAAALSHGKGVAFHVQPSTGTLRAFQQLIVEITAYNNMWGEYRDELVCQVGDLQPKLIPMQMTVKGCPIFLQMTGPQTEQPIIRFGTHVSGGSPAFRRVRLNNPTPFAPAKVRVLSVTEVSIALFNPDIRLDWQICNHKQDDENVVDLLMFFGDPFPPKSRDENKAASLGSTSESETELQLEETAAPCGSVSAASHTADEPPGSDSRERGTIAREATTQKIVSVLIRPHEGLPADIPFSITPRQTVVPAGGSTFVGISFTPSVLPEFPPEVRCEGVLLGFLSLDDRLAEMVPNKVHRRHGYEAPPFRVGLRALVQHALLKVDTAHNGRMVFHCVASDLVPDQPLPAALTDSVKTQSLKLTNCTKVPLRFRLLLAMPFSLSSTDPRSSAATPPSKQEGRGQQPQLVLHPQQHALVKVSFHTTPELLTHQHLPEPQLRPGFQVLRLENGEKKLQFNRDLVIEHSNSTTQLVPLTAYLTVPVLELSCSAVDFETCLVAQPKAEHVLLRNRSGCRSYWAASLDEQECCNDLQVFCVSPARGVLEAQEGDPPTREVLQISFTARSDIEYETTVTITGLLGEEPCKLQLRGRGTYDRKKEEL